MLKKTALITTWFLFTLATLVISLYSLLQIRTSRTSGNLKATPIFRRLNYDNNSLTFASLPQAVGEINTKITSQDARSEILYQYLRNRNSPLSPFAEQIVRTSDQNGIDFRLPVAIAECESNLCEENKFPHNSYNCWGYGIHSQGSLKFDSFEQGIDKVIEGLKKFKDRGYLTSIEKLMELYTPPSIEVGGTWAKCVTHFMDLLK